MNGIKAIASYVPTSRASNIELLKGFELDHDFIENKIGVIQRAVKDANEDTSDLAVAALEKLLLQTGLPREAIEVLIVVTQNPDSNIPHVSGLVHGKANLPLTCATFDISLGCSGYVYGLSVIQSFMASNGLMHGVLVTCDPYSKVIDQTDKSTVLLFGDAATATLIGPQPILRAGPFLFGSQGDIQGALTCREGLLRMNGREVFNFAATVIPKHVNQLLAKADVEKSAIDLYLFHQGSRFIVETLIRRLGLDASRVPIDIADVGNTVSSSIPLLLEKHLHDQSLRTILLCGFGVGLSWSSCICQRLE